MVWMKSKEEIKFPGKPVEVKVVLDINKFPYKNLREFNKDKDLIDLVEKQRVNLHIFSHTPEKRTALKVIQGYKILRGKGTEIIPIDECDQSKIGKAFWNDYNAARNRMDVYEDICHLASLI